MKFVCEGMILSDAAITVSKACAVRTVTPVLECIKIEAKNDVLTLTAYDGEISIEKKIKAEILEEGEVCVNGKFFADFMGKISFAEVLIFRTSTCCASSDSPLKRKMQYVVRHRHIILLPLSFAH